jgi:hypothetical protein
MQTEVIVHDPREDVPEWAIKHYQTWQEGMKLPEFPPLPKLPATDTSETPTDVEMDFDEEGISIDTPHIDVIITGEVGNSRQRLELM